MKPIKRHPSLQQLSREHHFALLFCWKLRQGLKYKVSMERMQSYAVWFWKNNQVKHFELEETKLFPILGMEHPKVIRALEEHKQIESFFHGGLNSEQKILDLEELLAAHVRFEERDLFNEIQQIATPEQLKLLDEHDHQKLADNWPDEFWMQENNLGDDNKS